MCMFWPLYITKGKQISSTSALNVCKCFVAIDGLTGLV